MKRTQDNGIHFGEDNELRLIREMFEEQPSHGVYEGYRVEGNSQSVQFTPEQLAELCSAIREMLRMAEQHRDALTDGASPEPAALTVGKADLVSEADMALLGMLSEGVTLKMGHPALSRFRNRGWVEITAETGAFPTWSSREYCITDAGRRVLAEREG